MRIIERVLCKICGVRKPRRFCPGVEGDICSICCGTERELTVRCPFECPYLQESRRYDQPPLAAEESFPNQDIKVTESFLRKNEPLLMMVSAALTHAALSTPGALDADVREALSALIRTYRTLESGLYYETRPANPIAASIQARVQEETAKLREQIAKESGMHQIRDVDILGVLAFLERLSIQHDNGRRLGRSFLHFMLGYFAQTGEAPPQSPSLLVP
jgi:hypothetical protein